MSLPTSAGGPGRVIGVRKLPMISLAWYWTSTGLSKPAELTRP